MKRKKETIDVVGEIFFPYYDLDEIVLLYDTNNLEMTQICSHFFHSSIQLVQPIHGDTKRNTPLRQVQNDTKSEMEQ